jgi:hypothetical protein
MAQRYLHVEVSQAQSSKRVGAVSGDVIVSERDAVATTIVVADGIGSGVKAHLFATMVTARFLELVRRDFSPRQAFSQLVQTMHQARGTDLPYAVFTVIRVLNDGETTILSYEMPFPLLFSQNHLSLITARTFPFESEVIGEANLFLEPGEGILAFSDGITMAGMGMTLPLGWSLEGIRCYANDILADRTPARELARLVHDQARLLWQGPGGDDCSVVFAHCRRGEMVTVFSGPPLDKAMDSQVVSRFLAAPGTKVVCGAMTAKIVARGVGKPLRVEQDAQSAIAPPRYYLNSVDLVTEGAVTLNQAYNVLEADPGMLENDTGVTLLCQLLLKADRIQFLVGGAENAGHTDISFRQKGILPRRKIIQLLAEKLRELSKLCLIDTF